MTKQIHTTLNFDYINYGDGCWRRIVLVTTTKVTFVESDYAVFVTNTGQSLNLQSKTPSRHHKALSQTRVINMVTLVTYDGDEIRWRQLWDIDDGLAILVTNIHYSLTWALGTNVQKMSPISKLSYQQDDVTNIIVTINIISLKLYLHEFRIKKKFLDRTKSWKL